ncbi:MAG: GtrA family protein [Thalassotalea sp.]|nr:GtrA family protein [Thalassotalea sp.]
MKVLKFAVIGVLGFVFDALFFYVFMAMIQAPMIARLIAFWLAASLTWWGNRQLTFAELKRASNGIGLVKQWWAYMCTAHLAGAANLASFYWLSLHYPIALAFCLGIIVGAMFNYLLSSRFVFQIN